jgi:hypothetical protein
MLVLVSLLEASFLQFKFDPFHPHRVSFWLERGTVEWTVRIRCNQPTNQLPVIELSLSEQPFLRRHGLF